VAYHFWDEIGITYHVYMDIYIYMRRRRRRMMMMMMMICYYNLDIYHYIWINL